MEGGSEPTLGAGSSLPSGSLSSQFAFALCSVFPLSQAPVGVARCPVHGHQTLMWEVTALRLLSVVLASGPGWVIGLPGSESYVPPSGLGEEVGLHDYLRLKGPIRVSTCPSPLIFKVKRNELVI